jgi:hypothetical protein
MPIITALGRLRQEDLKFEGNLGYIAGPSLKTTKKKDHWNRCSTVSLSRAVSPQARTIRKQCCGTLVSPHSALRPSQQALCGVHSVQFPGSHWTPWQLFAGKALVENFEGLVECLEPPVIFPNIYIGIYISIYINIYLYIYIDIYIYRCIYPCLVLTKQ